MKYFFSTYLTAPRLKNPKWFVAISLASVGVLIFSLLLPPPNYVTSVSRSAILFGHDSTWLAGSPSNQQQWSFVPLNKTPDKYFKALVMFEDKRFHTHVGIDVVAIARAIKQNAQSRAVVSGASTLTMQLARLYYHFPKRTFFNKIREAHLALRTEIHLSKSEILHAYSACAPFGGNIIGVEAASMRYFNRLPSDLSWAEAALLAVLPNNPSLLFPGSKTQMLAQKRNILLKKLYKSGAIDSLGYVLAIQESIPAQWQPVPTYAWHALEKCKILHPNESTFYTGIDTQLQQVIKAIWQQHKPHFTANGIHNSAVLVLEVETGVVKAYQANLADDYTKAHTGYVDCIQAPRSTGSILKPLLFAQVLEAGMLTPRSLVPDVPTMIGGYVPRNHDLSFEGAVPFKNAIYRSLNVPAVRVLHEFGIAKFHQSLCAMGMSTLSKPPTHYGLTLILGGAEGTLWDICGIYASMARSLTHYNRFNGVYFAKDWHKPTFFASDSSIQYYSASTVHTPTVSASVVWHTLEAMKEVYRPDMEEGWKNFPHVQHIAWKTGTSFGNRDAWAIGVTPTHVVGVWVGNANGEGRPELTGIKAAAPVLFDIFRWLPQSEWFTTPVKDMQYVPLCAYSGYKANECCERIDTVLLTKKSAGVRNCTYCKPYFLDIKTGKRVHSDCESISKMQKICRFQLPPTMAAYYAPQHPTYKTIPAFRDDCNRQLPLKHTFEIIYPTKGSKIFIPRELDGQKGMMVAKVAVLEENKVLFWHLDEQFLGTTSEFHHLPMTPAPGKHALTVVDEAGESVTVRFELLP